MEASKENCDKVLDNFVGHQDSSTSNGKQLGDPKSNEDKYVFRYYIQKVYLKR